VEPNLCHNDWVIDIPARSFLCASDGSGMMPLRIQTTTQDTTAKLQVKVESKKYSVNGLVKKTTLRTNSELDVVERKMI
jgi:hypothetical protein